MDFGKIDKQALEKTDFSLQTNHVFNAKVLKNASKIPIIKVGCPVWSVKEWNGKIYPNYAKTLDLLRLYSQQFNTIELNVTHYQIPSDKTIDRWLKESTVNFTFCPKFPQVISHDKLLLHAENLTEEFCHQILKLGHKLGLPFLQLAPFFTPKQLPILEKYLKIFPDQLKIAVEFRHGDWFTNVNTWSETLAMLHELGHTTVITDAAGRRDVVHQSLSVPKAFIRWIGNDHPTDYKRIDEWVSKIKGWLEEGLEVLWLFIHTNENINAPEMANYWIQQLHHECELKIEAPKFQPKVEQMSLF
jgi:hypothetical protein